MAVLRHFNKVARSYDRGLSKGLWRKIKARETATVINALSLNGRSSLLDIGCGTGHYMKMASDAYGCEVFGIDPSVEMIHVLREKGLRGENTTLERWRPEQSFDRILIAGVMEFASRPEDIFSACAGISRPGAKLVILVPRFGLVGWLYKIHHWAFRLPVRLRSKVDYLNQARNAGWRCEEASRAGALASLLVFQLSARRP